MPVVERWSPRLGALYYRAPARPGREVADKGRHAEIAALMAKVKQKLG